MERSLPLPTSVPVVPRRVLLLVSLVFVAAACGGGSSSSSSSTTSSQTPDVLLSPDTLTAQAPATYDATFHTSAGDFVVTVHRGWAPNGADRFYNLVKNGFYDGQRIFRVVPGFVVQWGISPYPEVSAAWQNATIKDDPVTQHNDRGTITFATAGPDTRTTQVFVNLADNRSLDSQGFAPFGKVTSGLATFDKLYSGYGDQPTANQQEMSDQGEAYFKESWPKLDTIESATVGS
jgi:peptidyl-prolyl cis-trans isomerase A (cyclophilin A)